MTAGTCSSRLVFNVPKSRSVGGELEMTCAPTNHFDFALGAATTIRRSRNLWTAPRPPFTRPASGTATGCRACPKFQLALSATYQAPISPNYWGYVTGNYQHVGSRYTQLVDQEPGLGVINLQSFG